MREKMLDISEVKGAKANISDLNVYGDGDTFALLCKASSQEQGWMKSTKAMEIEGVGCLVQVTTQNEEMPAEAVTFVPGVRIQETKDEDGKVISRKLVVLKQE